MPGRPIGLLLTVKQTVPPVRRGAIRRGELLTVLREANTRLITVVAPAGWGKTTLLSDWAGDPGGSRIAWVSLDAGDDEPVRFWSYVLAALSGASDEISGRALRALAAPGADPLDVALPLLLNELARASAPHVLVLDDYHVLTDPRIHEGVEFLVTYLPPSSQLVLAGRADPPLPIARLRARAELTEVRAADLRFSRDEADSLVSTVSGTALDAATAAAVWDRTEGWASGLHLAGLALRGAPVDGTSRFRAGDRHLLDYVSAEILPALSPAQRALLVRAAPLERLSGDLCDAALQVTGSRAILAELDRADLFVTALDDDREWYRCHHLFRDVLTATAGDGATDGDGARGVLTRAAGWFAAHELIDEAAAHLLRSGDDEATARFLESHETWFSGRGRAAIYLAHGERLPPAAVGPSLALSLAYTASISGRRDRVGAWLDACEARLTPGSTVRNWRDAGAAVLAMRAMVGTPDSEPGLAVARARRALELETAAGNPRNPVARTALGISLFLDGRFAEALDPLADAWRHRVAYGWSPAVSLQIAGLVAAGLVELNRGDEAERVSRAAAGPAEEAEAGWGAAAAPVVVLLREAEGRLRYLRGEVEEARERLSRAVALAEVGVRPTWLVQGLVLLADAQIGCGDHDAARRSLARARDVADEEPVTPFQAERLQQAEARLGSSAARRAVRSGVLAEELTDRELSILRKLPGDATQREIGAAMFLSVNTVKAYTKSLYRKLGVSSRQDAVVTARELGVI